MNNLSNKDAGALTREVYKIPGLVRRMVNYPSEAKALCEESFIFSEEQWTATKSLLRIP